MGNQIHLACWRDDIITLQKLESTNLTLFKRPGVFGASAFHVAVFRGNIKCMKFILNHTQELYSDLHKMFGRRVTAMQIVKDTGQNSVLKLLKDAQETRYYTLLVLTTQYRNLPFVKAITTRKEYDPNYCWS